MTYSSCWVEIVKFNPDGFGETISKRTEMLWRPKSMYWLPTLKKWAKARDIEIDYVDNCWIRVNVDRCALEEFLREEVQDSEAVIPKIGPVGDFRYVLVAEEFQLSTVHVQYMDSMPADEMADESDGIQLLNGNALEAIVAITTDLRQLPIHGTMPLEADPVIIGQE